MVVRSTDVPVPAFLIVFKFVRRPIPVGGENAWNKTDVYIAHGIEFLPVTTNRRTRAGQVSTGSQPRQKQKENLPPSGDVGGTQV